MKDRVPGAPGRCTGLIAGEELQKLQAGKPFAITLRRDDQPIQEGTPYSKAAVLPDALAATLCPEVEDPAPKDAFAALHANKADTIRHKTGTVIAAGNSANTPLKGLKLYGKTTQNGTPAPGTPAQLESAGRSGSIQITLAGKNLCSVASINTTVNKLGSITIAKLPKYFSACTVSADITRYKDDSVTNSRIGVVIYYTDNTNSQHTTAYDTGNVEADGVTRRKSVICYPTKNKTISHMVINCFDYGSVAGTRNAEAKNIQLELGSAATEYEPYLAAQTLTVSTPHGLPGVPVSSGGNYTDVNGKQWVCDEIDFSRGVYVQRVKTVTINGGVAWTKSGAGLYSYAYLTDALPMKSNNITGMSDRIPQQSWSQLSYDYISHVNMDSGIQFRNVVANFGLPELTSDAFNAYLAENPITIAYPLKTPKETALSAEIMDAYAALHTNNPSTTVYNDADAAMELTYYTPTTAVQMVHSPADAGKFLSIDEHGCVVLSRITFGTANISDVRWTYRKWSNGFAECWGTFSGECNLAFESETEDFDALYVPLALPFPLQNDGNRYFQATVYPSSVEIKAPTIQEKVFSNDMCDIIVGVEKGTTAVTVDVYVAGMEWKEEY